MILPDTNVWGRWLAPGSMPLAGDVLATIDAADRFIIATAASARCALLTLDETVRKYPAVQSLHA